MCREKKNKFVERCEFIRKRLEEKVTELVDVGAPDLWGHFKDGVLKAYDDVGGKKRGRDVKEIHGGGI